MKLYVYTVYRDHQSGGRGGPPTLPRSHRRVWIWFAMWQHRSSATSSSFKAVKQLICINIMFLYGVILTKNHMEIPILTLIEGTRGSWAFHVGSAASKRWRHGSGWLWPHSSWPGAKQVDPGSTTTGVELRQAPETRGRVKQGSKRQQAVTRVVTAYHYRVPGTTEVLCLVRPFW